MPRSNSAAVAPATLSAGALTLAAVLAGCVAGPNYVVPPAPTAASYSADALPNLAAGNMLPDAALAAPAQWWTLLDSPRLDSTIRAALAANRNLEAARTTLAEAQSNSAAAE